MVGKCRTSGTPPPITTVTIETSDVPMDYQAKYGHAQRELEETKEKFQKRLIAITTDYDTLEENKDKEISSLQLKIKKYNDNLKLGFPIKDKPNGSEDNFRIKSKTKKGNEKVSKARTQSFVCGTIGCEMENMDLIKCYRCDKWVCETCHCINVAKLKTLMAKCNTLYFLCNDCDSKSMCIGGDMSNNDSSENLTNTSNQLLDIEARLNKTITTKLKDAMDKVESQVNKIFQQGQSYADMAKKNLSPNDSVAPIPTKKVAQELRTIIREERNELRVQEAEKESRATNFIIHGIQWDQTEVDFGNKLKDKDRVFLEDFLNVLGTTGKPSERHRLGRFVPESGRMRPMKVVMSSVQEKEVAMKNLNQLKNAADKFRKLGIKDDYTREEREEIKTWVAKAKDKNEQNEDSTFIWRVRGCPKNGLRSLRMEKR